ncbi:MAG: hypothetical protein IJT49_02260 [Clostridia bacterium]|nr:hypothetical protein [Clostridia bacterium]
MLDNSDIIINSKSKVKITGVEGITGFGDTEAVFKTSLGYLAITGSSLTVDGFDREEGTVDLTGNISAVFYPGGKKNERGLFGKLFGKDN